jgi:hypothetical protein
LIGTKNLETTTCWHAKGEYTRSYRRLGAIPGDAHIQFVVAATVENMADVHDLEAV